jgi:tRNA (adenine22-N1)-methyltransferase
MPRNISLDARLSLAYDLYDPCELAADIGTDHAHLPAALLQRGRCQHMILTDLSESALRNARDEMIRFRLTDRVSLRQGDGLSPLREKCGMISITGMGGRTVRDILLSGKEKLQGASLVLSAHTDLPLIREAVSQIGYHTDREEPCFCAGRFYLVLRARPGARPMTEKELRLGGPLFESASDQLIPYLQRRREVLECSLKGLLSAEAPDEALIAQVREDIRAYDDYIVKGMNPHDRTGCV